MLIAEMPELGLVSTAPDAAQILFGGKREVMGLHVGGYRPA